MRIQAFAWNRRYDSLVNLKNKPEELVVVTGMSGAGKTMCLKMFEDMGYSSVDNLPLPLLPEILALRKKGDSEPWKHLVLCLDIRSGEGIEHLAETLEESRKEFGIRIVFLDASNEVLIRRYKETRRSHPLMEEEGRLEDGIEKERLLLRKLRKSADYVIDTTNLLTYQLREKLEGIFLEGREYKRMNVNILSFGFKYGLPEDADLVFDVRYLPNPFYEPSLRDLTGETEAVRSYVFSTEEAPETLARLTSLLQYLLPKYEREGKNLLVIGIGCTGGKHRSVTMALKLFEALRGDPRYGISIIHRDKDRRKR